MNDNNNPLSRREKGFFDTDISSLIILTAVIVALSALSALGIGGVSCVSLSGAALAFLLLSRKNIVSFICVPLSFGAAYLISGDAVTGAVTLLFVPVGVVLASLVLRKKSLSVTVAVMTVVIAICAGLYFTFLVMSVYGNDIKEAYLAFGKDIESATKELLDSFRFEDKGEAASQFGLSEESINEIFRSFFLLLPSVVAVIFQLMAYGAAKLCRLACHVFGYDSLYCGAEKAITVSAPAGFIFVGAYFISFLSRNESVIAYSAFNLTYLLMPMLAIGGFHSLFGKKGIIRRQGKSPFKMAVIISCAICAVLSPLSAIPLLAMFGAMSAVGGAIGKFLRERAKNRDDI